MTNVGLVKLDGMQNPIDFSKNLWRNSEIILNIPLREFGEYVSSKLKGNEMPSYFIGFLGSKI